MCNIRPRIYGYTIQNIEDIVVGDQVVGWTGEERDIAKVTDIHPTILGDRKLYGINGLDITSL